MSPSEQDAKDAKKNARKKAMKNDEDEEDAKGATKNVVASRKGKESGDKKKAEEPGGTWQQFMAWVPNGAALLNPEPWKPLPDSGLGLGPGPGGGSAAYH